VKVKGGFLIRELELYR